jgi:predicted acyltransferase
VRGLLKPVRTRALGILGLIGLGYLAALLALGKLTLVDAAVRAAILLAVLVVLEHFVLPVVKGLVGPPGRPQQDAEPDEPQPGRSTQR